jgi:hypothetical protein
MSARDARIDLVDTGSALLIRTPRRVGKVRVYLPLSLWVQLSAVALPADALWLLHWSERMLPVSQHSASSSHTGQAQRPPLLVPTTTLSRWAAPVKSAPSALHFGVTSSIRILAALNARHLPGVVGMHQRPWDSCVSYLIVYGSHAGIFISIVAYFR